MYEVANIACVLCEQSRDASRAGAGGRCERPDRAERGRADFHHAQVHTLPRAALAPLHGGLRRLLRRHRHHPPLARGHCGLGRCCRRRIRCRCCRSDCRCCCRSERRGLWNVRICASSPRVKPEPERYLIRELDLLPVPLSLSGQHECARLARLCRRWFGGHESARSHIASGSGAWTR